MQFLRQSTASQEVIVGPFLDDTDGKTAETALSIANTDIKIWKTGTTTEADKNSGGGTHIAGGRYSVVLDATDSNTIGPMEINVHVSGALPVKLRCCVLDEAVYDVLFGTTAPSTYAGADTSGTTTLLSRIGSALTITSGRVNADITHIATAAVSTSTAQLGVNVVNFGGSAGTFASGRPEVNTTHAAGAAWGSGAITAASIAAAALNGKGDWNVGKTGYSLTVSPLDAAGVRAAVGLASANLDTQLTAIDDYLDTEVAAIKAVTDKLDTALELDSTVYRFTVNALENAPSGGGGGLDAAGVRAAIGLASANLDTQLTAIDDFLDTEIAAIKAKTDNLPSDPADASDIATAFGTVNTKLDTIDDFLDTEIAAIKAKTDNLPASPAASGDIPAASTVASAVRTELGTELGRIDVAISTRGTGAALDAAGVRTAVGLASANLDTQLADIPTVSEFEARTIVSANYATAANLATVAGYLDLEIAAILEDTGTTIPAQISALNNLSAAQVNAEVDQALADYDAPTNAEMVARTLAAASYATAANQTTIISHLTDVKGATFSGSTDSLEAIRDRGDSAWATATGFAVAGDIPTANQNAAALMDLADGVETGLTPRQAMRLLTAALAGELSGAATTTIVIRNTADTKNRITATVDADGNRTAITYDVS